MHKEVKKLRVALNSNSQLVVASGFELKPSFLKINVMLRNLLKMVRAESKKDGERSSKIILFGVLRREK